MRKQNGSSSEEPESWNIRELTTNEDNDSLFIEKWKIPFMQLWGSFSLLTSLVDVYMTFLVGTILLDLVKERSVDLTLAITILAFILGIGALAEKFLWSYLQLFAIWGEWAKCLRLVGDNVPLVDIIVPCCNEPLDVLRDTILGVLAIDYPHNKYRVVVADDGACSALQDWIATLKCQRLYYHARKKPAIPDFKAGNLNQAIDFMEGFPGGPAEYIASLDADMIPEKRWLRAVMPHMVLDSRMGMVCPSQSYYHTPHNDLLIQDGRSCWNVDSVYRNLADFGLNSGSGFVLRREAILEIGGFPAPSLLEDTYSSVLMMSKGWRTKYLSEALQYGLVPESYLASVKQFRVEGVQLAMHFKYYLLQRYSGALSMKQRIFGLLMGWGSLYKPFLQVLSMVGIPCQVMFIGTPLIFRDASTTILLIRLQCISQILGWLSYQHRTIMSDYRAMNRDDCVNYYIAPYYAWALLRSFFLPQWLGGAETVFTASGSIKSHINERNPQRRAPLVARARFMLFDLNIIFHLCIFLSTLLALVWAIWKVYSKAGIGNLSYELTRDVAWSIPSATRVVFSTAIPIQYMLAPPDCSPRDEAMDERDEAGARYPKESSRDYQSTSHWHFGLTEACDLGLVSSMVLFLGTWPFAACSATL
ncbi:hypothetical protein EYB26_001746 [Talaromyces marneffei]|uniref:uncharacterized protein n=1 Tax=Talaromyces marneffei TaxID=37727 RepID=UPI0012A909B7|nr:uncharacterized protein EYB26_001746 [Talaromyces marneffei]QGA14093.1 hypothetical protein EYB26_001746 [Talaromyces marneffei]